jgi:hypothetical protein
MQRVRPKVENAAELLPGITEYQPKDHDENRKADAQHQKDAGCN